MTSLDQDLEDVVGPAPRPALSVVPTTPKPNPLLAELERCRPFLEPTLNSGRHSWDDVVRMIVEGKAQLWPGKTSAMVTEVHQFSTGKTLQCWLGGGDMAEMMAMEPGILAWARLVGCTEVLVEGRRGWERALKGAGYDLWSVSLRKAI